MKQRKSVLKKFKVRSRYWTRTATLTPSILSRLDERSRTIWLSQHCPPAESDSSTNSGERREQFLRLRGEETTTGPFRLIRSNRVGQTSKSSQRSNGQVKNGRNATTTGLEQHIRLRGIHGAVEPPDGGGGLVLATTIAGLAMA